MLEVLSTLTILMVGCLLEGILTVIAMHFTLRSMEQQFPPPSTDDLLNE